MNALVAALLLALAAPAAAAPATGGPGETAAPAHARKADRERRTSKKIPMAGVVNVNRASEAELRLLPGIGKKRAEAIVARREKRPFASLDEVGRLRGMRNVVHKLRAHLTISGDTTLHPERP